MRFEGYNEHFDLFRMSFILDVEDGPPSRLPLQRQFISQFPQIDANALNDIEVEAQYLAANIDGINENLANLLHSVSLPFQFKQPKIVFSPISFCSLILLIFFNVR